MASTAAGSASAQSLRKVLIPLALAQFICGFAGSNMNVMITSITEDLHTTVQGVQICITLFLIVMAALMIPCGKLTDRYGAIVGVVVLLALVKGHPGAWYFAPGLFLIGLGLGVALTRP
jgi:MFS family permease